ncbi:RICIN domain-containing protein [Sorangium sp. So ce367]|uniref:RICIN domain-containing protein n=1 Tax=Sorangium sp. So ce367 TaxID=3133305 RepID=UPI003F621440
MGCNGGRNQRFSRVRAGGGNYNIVATHSGLCLDVPGFSTSFGATIQQWGCNGGDNQRFRFVP